MIAIIVFQSIIIYMLLAIMSYKPFKRISNNGWADHPVLQSIVFPLMWFILLLMCIVEGMKHIVNNKVK